MRTLHKQIAVALGCALTFTVGAVAVGAGLVGTSTQSAVALPQPVATSAVRPTAAMTGTVEVVVRLAGTPLAAALGPNAALGGARLTPTQARQHLAGLAASQDAISSQIQALGGRETARLSRLINAVVFEIDAARLDAVESLAGVVSVREVVHYQQDLVETVPYIGALTAPASGRTGAGIRVAVLDSGIDYTHRNLGGPGTIAAYEAAHGADVNDPRNTTRDGLFPTAKVVEGFDFVGEAWPSADRTEDPDPIDFQGHGTHVADIIAGKAAGHRGVAPDASLIAIKVCSAVATSCNGVALLLGMDYAIDPNGDGSFDDAADVINLSLGSSYGQREDDLSLAVAQAARAGAVVVISAGNSADRPFIVGSPSATPEVISVAQTAVPSAITVPLVVNSPASIAGTYTNTNTVPWAPITDSSFVNGDLAIPSDPLACGPLPAGSLAGKVALVNRGTCSISLKVNWAATAGATGVVLSNNASGDAPTFSFGGGTNMVPTLVVTQAIGNTLRSRIAAGLTVNVTASFATVVSMRGSVVASSSRGPGYSYQHLKPDIGAPGASISAIAGSGTGTEAFGGTSGAAPMVAGSAALVLEAFPTATPSEVKARLMNTAETTVYTNPATQPPTQPGALAPITRIGGGEVRVDQAIQTKTLAWDGADPAAVGLSFGAPRLAAPTTLRKRVMVRNTSNVARSYTVTPGFRYAADEGAGVTFAPIAPLNVPANSTSSFVLTMTINPAALPLWGLTGGANGGNGALLQANEFDGYVTIDDGVQAVRLPWHVLPHRAANLRVTGVQPGEVVLSNTGSTLAGGFDVFALTGTSPQLPRSQYPNPGDNYALVDLRAVGVRQLGTNLQFAINTYGLRSHPVYPGGFEVQVDTNGDGAPDYAIYNAENGTFASTGQTVVFVRPISSATASAFFFATAELVSGNVIFTAPFSALGIGPDTKIGFSVLAYDNYFTGIVTDVIGGMEYTPSTPRYRAAFDSASAPINFSGALPFTVVPGGATASPSQAGFLLMYQNALRGRQADIVPISQ